ncbi:hypothetical protein Glove_97g60 [Diversispora epigaea]|uniref:Ion transport domain-containing protein n=1 Tax=Diversispora epigaea TaxID=1348612 RepID=A0A397JDN1_9GLOM|nr:hypothetical protein Glove_97g60 [Diversispora epigaea]
MSKKYYLSFLNESDKVSSGKSITSSTGIDSFSSCIAISPDSQYIVTFNKETWKFKLHKIDDLSKRIFTLEGGVSDKHDKHLCWSIAISNCVDNGKNERFIALSCFDVSGLRNKGDLESGDKYFRPQTWVISTTDVNEIYTSSVGGVIRFLDSDDSPLKNKTVIIIVNASGIFKETMNYTKRKRFFSRSSKIEQFELPQLSNHLSRDHWQNSCIIKNHFMMHSFKDRQQIIEMYSLNTGDLEMLFKRHESSLAPNMIHGSPIFSISQNEKILAFCRGTASITLYFMENGLEITTKQLEGQRGIYKIVDINFIDDDSKLLIVLEKEKEDRSRQIFVVWDLFTTFKNSIRQINYSEILKPQKIDVTHRLMNSHGKMFAVKDNGDIFSVLDHPDMALIRNPPAKAMTKIDIITRDHTIYLDSTESTHLIISSDTIQVWKYDNNSIEKRDKRRDRVLEYIWARNKAIDVCELRIGEREFELKVSVPSSTPPTPSTTSTPSTPSTPPKKKTIYWPNNVNVLKEACRALYVLRENCIEAGHENVNQIKYLIECTQRLVRKYITKYGIFRLTSIRYPIMKYLIKGYQESLIKHILNKKINNKNSNIYIPRLYKWTGEDNNRSTTEISDLHHATSCIQERGDSSMILKYLIDYYADNTKEYNNYGWMFTVTNAIPLLYDYHLREFVQYLFKKPCFGITEAYTSPLHITPRDQRKGNNAAVLYSLEVKPRLIPKFHNTLWFFLKNLFTRWYYRLQTSRNDRKIYTVPLPNFTVPPNPKSHEDYSKYFRIFTFFRKIFWPRIKVINNTQKMSPFLRVIHEEKGHEIYRTPTIIAVLDFKWSAARRYVIHHIIIYILYATSYTLIFETHSTILSIICFFVYHYTGMHLILTEIIQLRREGWHRYMNIYNIFDLGSVLLPLANFIYLYYLIENILPDSIFIPIYAFTDLVMWLEALLLMRYFQGPGRFVFMIISILNTVLPFFAFMLSAIVVFGHAMFILLKYEDDSDIQISTYKIEDTSNSKLYSDIVIKQDFDKSNRLDNRYASFVSSVIAVFFWNFGRWDQLDQWKSYAVDLISILGCIILPFIFQNMLIAFMNNAFDQANKESWIAAHRYRSERIVEYEALEKPFSKKSNPRYIYYIPNPDMIDTWLEETKRDEERLMGVSENLTESTESIDLTDFVYSDDNDDNGYVNQDNLSQLKKYRHIENEGSSSTMDLDSIERTTTCNDIIDRILFIDEEIFPLKVTSSKLDKLKNVRYNEPLSGSSTSNVDDQLSVRLDNLENELKTRCSGIEQDLRTILETLNNLNNP